MAKAAKPVTAFLDLDSVLFSAASAAEQVIYIYINNETGEEEARFEKAKDGKEWLELMSVVDDAGDLYRRETEYEYRDVKEAYKAFDKEVERWVKASECQKWTGYVSKNSGLPNFRHQLATLKPYKGSRSDTRKPYYLEHVRKYARKNPNIKTTIGAVETDDLVVARAEKLGQRGCVVSVDKDSRQVSGCWMLIIGEQDKPTFSSGKIVGRLRQKSKKKIVGMGYLFLLFQLLKGDSVDGIGGCKGVGDKGALEVLEPFSGKPLSELPNAIAAVCEEYKRVYGDEFKYKHHETKEEITATWKDILYENLRLLWMKRSKDDMAETIWEHVKGYCNE